MQPSILHLDIDAFFAAVEQLRDPRLAGRPVAVGTGVIASCSYEARAGGLRAGMPLREARRRCPDLEIVAGHAAIYRCFSERIFELCRRHAPAVETYLDEAYCDLGGTERLHGDFLALARRLRELIRREVGLTTTVGIARSRMLAKLAARSVKPDGARLLRPAEEDRFLRRRPVRDLPGIGPRAERLLDRLNIRTVGDLRALSRHSLEGIFGRLGRALWQRCRGVDTRVVIEREIPRSISRETSFPEPATSRETIEATLGYLTGRAAAALRELGLLARRIEVRIGYRDGEMPSRRRTLRAPTALDSELHTAAVAARRALHTRRVGLRRIGVTLSRFTLDTGVHQLELHDLFPGPGAEPRPDEPSRPGAAGSPGSPGSADFRPPADAWRRERRLLEQVDAIRRRYGYSALIDGHALPLLGTLARDAHGFVLRTPCLTR